LFHGSDIRGQLREDAVPQKHGVEMRFLVLDHTLLKNKGMVYKKRREKEKKGTAKNE